MSTLVALETWFRWMAEHGVWDLITAAAVLGIAFSLWRRSRRPLREVTVLVTHSLGNEHAAFPNTLGFEVRNPLDAPLLVTRPSFSFSKHLRPGTGAVVNTVSGIAELRFRQLLSDGTSASQLSHETATLRYREGAFAFVPIDDALSEASFSALAANKRLGTLRLDVVLLGESPPRSLALELPIKLSLKAQQEHSFGADGQALRARRASERPSSLAVPLK